MAIAIDYQARFRAYNAKITELGAQINEMDKRGEWDSPEYHVLCTMQGALQARRDEEQAELARIVQGSGPDWDGD